MTKALQLVEVTDKEPHDKFEFLFHRSLMDLETVPVRDPLRTQ